MNVHPGEYKLELKIVPRLITTTVPDQQKRRALLGSSDTGAVLGFEFYKLYNTGSEVTCSGNSSNPLQSYFDNPVFNAIQDALAAQRPIILPAESVLAIADQLLTPPESAPVLANLVGLNLGTEGDMEIGFQLDRGSTHPFDPQNVSELSFFQGADWGINIDTNLVTPLVESVATHKAQAIDPAISVVERLGPVPRHWP
jgi:hypothetical protein